MVMLYMWVNPSFLIPFICRCKFDSSTALVVLKDAPSSVVVPQLIWCSLFLNIFHSIHFRLHYWILYVYRVIEITKHRLCATTVLGGTSSCLHMLGKVLLDTGHFLKYITFLYCRVGYLLPFVSKVFFVTIYLIRGIFSLWWRCTYASKYRG